MREFRDRIAVITGGGSGIGRELARQLAREGCHVSICDLSEEDMQRTRALCLADAPEGTRVHTHLADVSREDEVQAFRDAVGEAHASDHIHLLFNNAGIAAAGSFVLDERSEWEQTFAVCWWGVYHGCRTFLPMLLASPEGHVVNTSSVNGFWATLGPLSAHTAYSAAKFAVKGFSEALINDFRLNAPHLRVSLVMPGHIGTSIIRNSGRYLGRDPKQMSDEELESARARFARLGFAIEGDTPDAVRQAIESAADAFRDGAATSADEAARQILEGVREERWRILVGEDARVLDGLVRERPEEAYEPSFVGHLAEAMGWPTAPEEEKT